MRQEVISRVASSDEFIVSPARFLQTRLHFRGENGEDRIGRDRARYFDTGNLV